MSIVIVEDRSFSVPQGKIIITGYVEIHKIRLACKDRMAIGDVDRAFQRRLQLGSNQPWPPPIGYWENDTFVIVDGRHCHIAAIMLGLEYIFVAWIGEG